MSAPSADRFGSPLEGLISVPAPDPNDLGDGASPLLGGRRREPPIRGSSSSADFEVGVSSSKVITRRGRRFLCTAAGAGAGAGETVRLQGGASEVGVGMWWEVDGVGGAAC